HGQLWNPQARECAELAEASPALRAPLRPHEFQLAEPGRALVRPLGSKGDPAGRVPKRGGPEGVHRRIPHGVEQRSEAVRLDRDGRIHHGETLPLPADVGEDPARLHQSSGPETKEIGVHLFHGHYTSITTLSLKDDTELRDTPTICAETCPGEQHILDLTSRPWQGPPRSFFWCGGFPESGMRAPS